jgi:hypothetical protein
MDGSVEPSRDLIYGATGNLQVALKGTHRLYGAKLLLSTLRIHASRAILDSFVKLWNFKTFAVVAPAPDLLRSLPPRPYGFINTNDAASVLS